MIYDDRHSGVFTTMMYSGPVSLKSGERTCPMCLGYGIRPVPANRGEKPTHLHKTCDHCAGVGKFKAHEPYTDLSGPFFEWF